MTFVRFGMIVTGKGEREFLPKFFRAMNAGAHCTFKLIRKSEQLRPITSKKRLLKLKGKTIPNIDEEQYGLPAHAYLRTHRDGYVLVVDDLEGHADPQAVFGRYRQGLDAVLSRQGRSTRAAVFFLVNMLEAYYLAHAACVNGIAGRSILSGDHDGDVEHIRHPKNTLKEKWQEFDGIAHGARIVERLDLNHVLGIEGRCRWLRSMFAWCIDRLAESGAIWDDGLRERFQLVNGACEPLVRSQGIASSREP